MVSVCVSYLSAGLDSNEEVEEKKLKTRTLEEHKGNAGIDRPNSEVSASSLLPYIRAKAIYLWSYIYSYTFDSPPPTNPTIVSP